jgi:hypothetical protein
LVIKKVDRKLWLGLGLGWAGKIKIMSLDYSNILASTRTAMGNPNWLEAQFFAKQPC